MWVPVDDSTTMVYNWDYLPSERQDPRRRPASADEDGSIPLWFRDARLEMGAGNAFGAEVDVSNGFRSIQNRGNRYLIDRQVQKTQTYTGIPGINVQDRAVQESMGRTADRTLERLGTTDRAIITARRMLLKAIATVEEGGNPPGVGASYYDLRPGERVIAKQASWLEEMNDLHRTIAESIASPV
jgi:hypothetical protein